MSGHTSVGLPIRLQSGRSRKCGSNFDREKIFYLFRNVQINSEDHPTYYSVTETSFARGYRNQDVMLTTRLYLMQRWNCTSNPSITSRRTQGLPWLYHMVQDVSEFGCVCPKAAGTATTLWYPKFHSTIPIKCDLKLPPRSTRWEREVVPKRR